MLAWERMTRDFFAHERVAREEMTQMVAPEELFTPETIAKLTALRARYCGHPEWIEFTLAERRLAFARWLVENGRLREDIEGGVEY